MEIERYGNAVVRILTTENADDALLFGCFAARKLLESCCIGMFSHLDPARLLILREYQMRGDYALTERQSPSIDWHADVISKSKNLNWTETVAPDKFVRAFLGGHLAEVAWLHAIDRLAHMPQNFENESVWVNELVSQYEARAVKRTETKKTAEKDEQVASKGSASEGILLNFRSSAQAHFSKLSKGVHLEFVVDPLTFLDEPTVKETIRSAVKLIAQLGFVFNLMDCTAETVELNKSANIIKSIEERMAL